MLPASGNIGLRQVANEYGYNTAYSVSLDSLRGVWGDVPAVNPIKLTDFYGKGRRVENWLTPYGNEGAFDQSPYYVYYSGLADDYAFPVYWFNSSERTDDWCHDIGAMDEGYNAGNGSDYVWTWLQTESWNVASWFNQFANAVFFLDNNSGYRADYTANHYGWYDVDYGSNGVGCYDGYEEYGGVGMWWYDSYIGTGVVAESGGYYW
jgi:hypothetical protein